MTERIAPNAELIGLHFFNRPATGAADVPDFLTPFPKTTDVRLMSTFQLISSPYDIIGQRHRAEFRQIADFARPRGRIHQKPNIINTFITFVIQIIRHIPR